MTIKKLVLLYGIAIILQLTLINIISIKGFVPHLIFCLTVAITFIYDEGYRCIPFAILAMIIVDICGAQYAGVGALALFGTGIVVIVFRRELNVEQWAPLIVTGILSTLVYHILYWSILRLMTDSMSFVYMLRYVAQYALYNTVILAVLFIIMSRHKQKRDSLRYDT